MESNILICWASEVGTTTEARPAVKVVPGTESWPQVAQTATQPLPVRSRGGRTA